MSSTLFTVHPDVFLDNRIQLHWASQLLSATADAVLERADDDSHSNLAWNPDSWQLEGRAESNLALEPFALKWREQTFPLEHKTLDEAVGWLSQKLQRMISFRDYDMPDHGVARGEPFETNRDALRSISAWLDLGHATLSQFSESRLWPHHFDMGFLLTGPQTGCSIGGGLSLGDHHYDRPYFYVNPYGIEPPVDFPPLTVGHWTDKWVGAVLPADEFAQEGGDHRTAIRFLQNAEGEIRKLFQ